MLKPLVKGTQGVALLSIGVFAVCLFAIGAKDRVITGYNAAGGPDGAQIFADNCASCHGANGEGVTGPQLAGVVSQMFPDAADQEDFVASNPPAGMPDFEGRLTPEEIAAVVAFTRAL